MQYNLRSNVGRFVDHHGDLLDNLQLVLYSQTRNCVQDQICTIGVGKSGCHGGRMTPATHVWDELTFCEVQCHGAHVFRISRANQLWSRRSRSWSKNLKGKDLVYLVALLMQMSTTKLDKMQRTIYTKINICIYFSLVSCSFHSGIFFDTSFDTNRMCQNRTNNDLLCPKFKPQCGVFAVFPIPKTFVIT